MFLQPDELIRLTGLRRPSAQVRWLSQRGWSRMMFLSPDDRLHRATRCYEGEADKMSDIVERLLQHIGRDELDEDDQIALVPRWEVKEAAEEIERLREEVKLLNSFRPDAELARLRGLLRHAVPSGDAPKGWYQRVREALSDD